MDPGKYNKYLEIQRATEVLGEFNDPMKSWQFLSNVWGSIDTPTAKEIRAGKDFQIGKAIIKIYPTDITNKDRILDVENGDIYDIETVIKPDDEYLVTAKIIK